MNIKDVQQALAGFRTTLVLGGPMTVRVHEALDVAYRGEPSRYFLSVDFKFKLHQALNLGQPGLYGVTKAEAVREAKTLSASIISRCGALNAAEAHARSCDNSTNRHTVTRQREALERVVGRYSAEFVS